jgi:dTDP-glucose 4,6-dehydratase
MREELGWEPVRDFKEGLRETVRWYLGNADWHERLRSGEYGRWLANNYGERPAL